MSAPQLTLAGKPVGRMGFGLMQLTWTPEPKSDEVSFAAMKAAADAGATAWSTAMFYGNPGHHTANIELIKRFFDKYPEYEDKIVLVVKGGIDESFSFPKENAIEYSRQELKRCQQLLGSKKIDVYTISRVYKDVEEIFREVKVLYDEGLFGAVGASEITAEALEKAHKIVPISVIEIEVSLWSYEQEIKDAIKWSTENKVPIFAYSPLGRGFITRTFKSPEDIPEGSFQKHCPRFQGEAFYDNLKLVDELDKLAEEKGLKTPQLALAWVCGLNPYMIPIPGSSDPERVKSNTRAADIKLTDKDLQGINDILANFEVKGGRYPESHSAVLMENQ